MGGFRVDDTLRESFPTVRATGLILRIRPVELTSGGMREIRRRTRRKFAPEEKVRIVLEGLRGEQSISELCRREGIALPPISIIAGARTSSKRARGSSWAIPFVGTRQLS